MRTIETERLILRAITENDTQAIFDNWASDPEVTRFMTWNAHRKVNDTRIIVDYWLSEYEKGNCYRWGIELKSDHTLIGMIDVVRFHDDGVPEIGYCESRKHWNRGYMTEALNAVTKHLFSEGYDEIRIAAVDENKASNKVIRKAGFEYVESVNTPHSPVRPEIVTINRYRLKKPR